MISHYMSYIVEQSYVNKEQNIQNSSQFVLFYTLVNDDDDDDN